MKTSLSIIIPTLNEEKYLPKILSDLVDQHHKNFEVIVIDGKSEDNTREVAVSFGGKLSLTFLEVEKRNVSYQRNTGAAKAQGEYLVFLDADSRIPADFTKSLSLICSKKTTGIILPTILPDGKSQKTKVLNSLVKTIIKMSQAYGRPLSTGGNFAMEKTLFEKLGGFNEDLFMSEDHDIVRRAYESGVKAKIISSVKVTISMRRGELEGDVSLIYKYVVGFLTYTVIPSDKALKAKLFEYEMGGHRYDRVKGKMGIKKKRIDMERLRQLLQLSAFLVMLRSIKPW